MKVLVIIFILCSFLYMIYVLVDAIRMYVKFFKYKEMDIFEKNKGKLWVRYLIVFVLTLIIVSGVPMHYLQL